MKKPQLTHQQVCQILLKKGEDIIKYVQSFLENLKAIKINEYGTPLLVIGLGLFVKVSRTFIAIHHLCQKELSEEAHSLLRVLVETVVTIQVIFSKDAEERAYRYLAYQYILDSRLINAWKSNPKLKDFPSKAEQIISERIETLKKEYGQDTYEEMREKLWKGIIRGKIEKAFDEANQKVTYDTIYRAASKNIHADDCLEYIKLLPDKSFLLIKQTDKGTPETLAAGALSLFLAMEVIGKAFKIGTPKEIKRRKKFFNFWENFFK